MAFLLPKPFSPYITTEHQLQLIWHDLCNFYYCDSVKIIIIPYLLKWHHRKTMISNTTWKTIGKHTSYNRINVAHFPEQNEWLNKYILTHISMSQEKQRDPWLGVWKTKQKMRVLSWLTHHDKSFHPKLYNGCSYLSMLGLKWFYVNSLWPRDAIRQLRSGSTLIQVMACCLTAPSHYLNQCWLIISKVLWHSSEGNFIRDTSATIHLS